MKLEKAIEILSDEPETIDYENDPDALAALKLGIEALKHERDLRLAYPERPYALLRGETEK